MNISLKALLTILCIIFLSGCIEIEDTYIINPDGSGKVTRHMKIEPVHVKGGASPDRPEKFMRYLVRKELEQAEGIEVWKDVSWELLDDGRISISATGYFPDIEEVSFYNNGYSYLNLNPVLEKTKPGRYKFRLHRSKLMQDKTYTKLLSDSALRKRVKAAKADLRAGRKMMWPWKNARVRKAFHFPGTIDSVSEMEQLSKKKARVEITGKQLLTTFDRLMRNETLLRRGIIRNIPVFRRRSPQWTIWGNEVQNMLEQVFLSFRKGETQFDYQREVENARKQRNGWLNNLQVKQQFDDAPLSSEPEVKGSDKIKEMRLAGWQILFEEKKLRFVFTGHFVESVADVTRARMEGLELRSGENLRRINTHAKILAPGSKFFIVFSTEFPERGMDDIQNVSGRMMVLIGSEEKTHSLNFSRILEGASEQNLGAKILDLERYSDQKTRLVLEVSDIEYQKLKGFNFYSDSGEKMNVDCRYYSEPEEEGYYECFSEQKIRDGTSIEAIEFQELSTEKLSLKLRNVSLAKDK